MKGEIMNDRKIPLIWAHRGASGRAPENTLDAFQMAADYGADGVELDIQLTRDEEIVVIHDETIDRTSDGAGWIKDFTLAELKEFNFNCGNPDFPHEDIPTMREVFELLKPTGLIINIELKTGILSYPGLEERILMLTEEMGMEERVLYSSFNHYSILKLMKLDPSVKTGFLYEDGYIDMPSYAAQHRVGALHPALYNLRYPNFMEDCRRLGIDVHVWTVNEPGDMLLCADAGVRAVITNYPELASEVLKGEIY